MGRGSGELEGAIQGCHSVSSRSHLHFQLHSLPTEGLAFKLSLQWSRKGMGKGWGGAMEISRVPSGVAKVQVAISVKLVV